MLRLLDELLEDGGSMDAHIYNCAMNSVAKSGRWELAGGTDCQPQPAKDTRVFFGECVHVVLLVRARRAS